MKTDAHFLSTKNLSGQINFADLEEKVLTYWDDIQAFPRSVSERPKTNPYVFYDGPPFATGLPHYGHLLGSIMKDIVPRYWTMKGFRVERRWGWDCHGLPIENIIESELKLQGGKKGIEAYGIANFNAACRAAILRFDREWQQVIRRIGRWVDMEHSYKTMDLTYMESVWWAFAQLYHQGLIYQGKKVILYCPRCGTPLSNFEIAMDNSYLEITENSTIYKFPVINEPQTYLLAWSTTPWNKLATPALAVNPDLTYAKVQQGEEFYYLSQNRLNMLNQAYKVIQVVSGQALTQLNFKLLYDFYPDRQGKKAGVVVADTFVTEEEGTGIVTLAIYGEDDYRVMIKNDVQLIEHIDEAGKIKPEVAPFANQYILDANALIDADLKTKNLIYKHEPLTHSVPVCYRCQTRLYYAPLPAWFIDIQKLKPALLKNNQKINWYPTHLKDGRFGKGLLTAPDWNISRSRYWGTPIPIWIGRQTGKIRVIDSLKSLKTWAVNQDQAAAIQDIHRENLDDLPVYVDDLKTEIGDRISEVFDCWVESGSMPYAAEHYPFENKQLFESRFPAQFICEYIAQTRAWFYTLHVMSTAIFQKPAFKHALTTGTIMAEDGTKMSKSRKNFPDPMAIVADYGVDALRLYFASSPVMKTAQNVNFNKEAINDIRKKTLNTIWHVFKFYQLFADQKDSYGFPQKPENVMDLYLAFITQTLHQTVIQAMDHYDLVTASRALMDYVSDLSTWYLRRSRDRLRQGNSESLQVLRTALREWALLAAPFAPFITEVIYQNLPGKKKDSIHLDLLAPSFKVTVQPELLQLMTESRLVVEKAHALRKEANLKVRQPLASLTITSPLKKPKTNLLAVIADEVNVKKVIWLQGQALSVSLNTKITPALKAEGDARELVRQIMDLRKKAKTSLTETIVVELPSWPPAYENYIKTKVLATSLKLGSELKLIRSSK